MSGRHNPERLAWIVLSSAFAVFCSMAVLIPLSIYGYMISATQPLPAELTSVRGIVLMGDANAGLSTSVTDGSTVTFSENYAAATDETSQAIITFADDSSLTLYGSTHISLQESEQPRFGISSNPSRVTVRLEQGRIRATAARSKTDLLFEIVTPHAVVTLDQGSYSIETDGENTQVTTRLGQADISSPQGEMSLSQGQRIVLNADTPLGRPLPAAQNLLSDSTFTPESLNNSWESYAIVPIESVTTTASVVLFQDQPVLNLRSQGEDNVHSEVGVVQMVNKDVRDFQSLRVFAEVRLVEQSLPGGGQLGSEFPVMLHVAYKDAAGNDRDWFHGFYFKPAPDNYILYDQPDNSSERIARGRWYPYESVNLLTTLGPAKPVFVKSIRIYASGWIYDSMLANISLLAEE
ncbi:MAG: hypothetical protein D6768_19840 [Chloroflexi bacterium]|nr:MAG: hypothetical protein D6768_19840 [Chloroflexota bacterium]